MEGYIGPTLYEKYASKERFSRELLQSVYGMTSANIEAIPQGEAFGKLVEVSGLEPWTVTEQLYNAHAVGTVWYIMTVVGILSAGGIWLYGRWILTLSKK